MRSWRRSEWNSRPGSGRAASGPLSASVMRRPSERHSTAWPPATIRMSTSHRSWTTLRWARTVNHSGWIDRAKTWKRTSETLRPGRLVGMPALPAVASPCDAEPRRRPAIHNHYKTPSRQLDKSSASKPGLTAPGDARRLRPHLAPHPSATLRRRTGWGPLPWTWTARGRPWPSGPGTPGATGGCATSRTRPSAARSAAGRAGSAGSSTPIPANTGPSAAAPTTSASRKTTPPEPSARPGSPTGSRRTARRRSSRSAAATASSSACSGSACPTSRSSASTSARPSSTRPGAISAGRPGVRLALATGLRLPFADRSFDLVLTSAVILHNPPPEAERIRREVVRVVAPAGRAQRGHERQLQPVRLRHCRLVPRRGIPVLESGPIEVDLDPDRDHSQFCVAEPWRP